MKVLSFKGSQASAFFILYKASGFSQKYGDKGCNYWETGLFSAKLISDINLKKGPKTE